MVAGALRRLPGRRLSSISPASLLASPLRRRPPPVSPWRALYSSTAAADEATLAAAEELFTSSPRPVETSTPTPAPTPTPTPVVRPQPAEKLTSLNDQVLGSHVSGVYEPESLLRNPPHPSAVTLDLLLASQAHLGHATRLWNPANADYIYGVRQGVHIIRLEATAAYLARAAKVVEAVARRGGLVLFVGTRAGQARAVVNAARLAGGYHVFERWVPGTLTNGQRVLAGCALQAVDARDRPVRDAAVAQALESWPPLRPDLVVCLNPRENEPLLHECGLLTIPTVGVIDTDADPTRVTYPIPANDDSLRCIALLAGVLGRAGQAGQKARLAMAEAGQTPYEPVSMEEIRKFDGL